MFAEGNNVLYKRKTMKWTGNPGAEALESREAL